MSLGGEGVKTFVMRTVTLFWAASLTECISRVGSGLDIQPSRPAPRPGPCVEGHGRKVRGNSGVTGSPLGEKKEMAGETMKPAGGMLTACMFSGTVSLAQVCVGWASLQAEQREQSDDVSTT